MKTSASLRLTTAAAIVALAGLAHAAPYNAMDQDTMNPASGDAATGYSAAEQNALSDQVTGLAGFFDTTVSATVWYNTGGNNIAADGVRVTVPILMWENDSFQDTPVIEVLTDGTVAGAHSINTGLDDAADAQVFQLNNRNSAIISFSNVTGANANNVFVSESLDGLEGDFDQYNRGNTVGQILPNGVLLWRVNFDNNGPSVTNNIEALDLTGVLGPNNGAALAPADTSFLNPTPTVAFGSGVKLLKNPGGANPATDDAGIDSGNDDGGSARLVVPRGERDGDNFDFTVTGWDGAFDGNQNSGLAPGGHSIFRADADGTLASIPQDVSMGEHVWPTYLAGTQWAPVLPSGIGLGSYRNGASVLFETDCGFGSTALHILAGYSVTNSSGVGATGEDEVLFVDAANAASAAGNGYSDGAYYFAASPNFQSGFFAGQYMAPMTGAGAPGLDADYRFLNTTGNASGGEGRMAPPIDANIDGDFVVVWSNRAETDGPAMGDPFGNLREYEVRLYEATLNGQCVANDYAAPFVIATNGTGIAARGITYNDGKSIDMPFALFCDDDLISGMFPTGAPSANEAVPFSGVSIDNQGNVAFTAVTELYTNTLDEDPVDGFPAFVECFNETPGFGNDSVELLDASTTSLFFYVRSEDALLEMVQGGIGGLELQADVAGSPDSDLSVVLGRFPGEDDSDRFSGTGLADNGFTLASARGDNVTSGVATLAFIPGSFDRNAGNAIDPMDMDNDDPSGVFLEDGITEQDGGLLIDRTQAVWETDGTVLSQVVTAVQGVAVVEFGDIIITPDVTNDCLADFDNDGDVDLTDFGTFGAAFGSMTGDANYNADADFDNDGDVDLTDFGTFGSEFGRMDCLD